MESIPTFLARGLPFATAEPPPLARGAALRAGAPGRPLGAHLADTRPGAVILVHGTATDSLHRPIPDATLVTCQADASGTYPIQGQDKYEPRGKFTTDENGAYYCTTVLPRPCTVPHDGPVGCLLRAGNRHSWRAAHHAKVRFDVVLAPKG